MRNTMTQADCGNDKPAPGAQPLTALCDALLALDLRVRLTDAERLTRTALIDALCEKSPEADAAFTAWTESDDDMFTAVEVLVAAVLKGARS